MDSTAHEKDEPKINEQVAWIQYPERHVKGGRPVRRTGIVKGKISTLFIVHDSSQKEWILKKSEIIREVHL